MRDVELLPITIDNTIDSSSSKEDEYVYFNLW